MTGRYRLRRVLDTGALPAISTVRRGASFVGLIEPPIAKSNWPLSISTASRMASASSLRRFIRHTDLFSGSLAEAMGSNALLVWYGLESRSARMHFLND